MRLFGEGFGDRHCSLETVSSFLDGAMREREMQRVESHLASCDDCAQQMEEMRSLVGVLRMMPTVPAPRSFAVPAPARVFVAEPARPWWQPAPVANVMAMASPMAGVRAMAAAAALALAVVFAGDVSGIIGTTEAPVQVGIQDAQPLESPGNPPGPEPNPILGEPPVPVPGTGDAPVVDAPVAEPAPSGATLVQHSWYRLELWPLELGLLALTAAMATLSFILRRRTSSS